MALGTRQRPVARPVHLWAAAIEEEAGPFRACSWTPPPNTLVDQSAKEQSQTGTPADRQSLLWLPLPPRKPGLRLGRIQSQSLRFPSRETYLYGST